MPARDDISGFRPMLQVSSAEYTDDHYHEGMDPVNTCDPSVIQLARAIAEAIDNKRPNLTLPPHIFIPWRAKPFMVDTRFILDNSTSFGPGATEAASAEGVTLVSEGAGYVTVTRGSFTVPTRTVAIVRQWAAQTDLLGYFHDSSGNPLVQFILDMSGTQTLFNPALEGNIGTLDRPFEVSYVVPQNVVIQVQANTTDKTMWHMIETQVSGYLVETRDIEDTLKSLSVQK